LIPEGARSFYTSSDLTRAFRVTLRQLQWWDERRVIRPRIVQHVRRYTKQEAVPIGVIERLRQCALSLQRIRKVLPRIESALSKHSNWRFLAVIGTSGLLFERDPAQMMAALAAARVPVVVVDLFEIHNILAENLASR
jgi:DNA-binding transcriptional MerR regulator